MDLEKTVRAAFTPCEPSPDFEDVVMSRLSAKAWRASQAAPRRRRHFLMFGVLFVVAAAAATGIAFRGELVPRVIAQPVASEGAAEKAVRAVESAAKETPAPALPVDLTVHLRSLQDDSTNAAVLAKVREYYAAIADDLSAIPGLHLINDRVAETAAAPASFRITIDNPDAYTAGQMVNRGQWAATFKVEVLKAGIYVPAQGTTRGGAFGPDSMAAQATGGPLSGSGCNPLILCSPAAIAAWQVKDLRIQLFPFDQSLQSELEARLLDPARSFLEQKEALNDLHDLGEKAGRPMSTAVVSKVLQQIANESDPGERGVMWYFLGGQRDPEMIQPLINAAQQDPDDSVRLGAVGQMAADFPSNPAVRAALQSIARRDPILLNRKVAERAVSGDAPWNEYVVATVQDTTQSAQQRLAPLHWMMSEQRPNPLASLTGSIFGKERQAFIDLLVQAGRETNGSISNWVLRSISSIQNPESARFLLAVFDAAPDSGHLLLLKDHLGDPRVRKRVEELAADPVIPTLQATAAGMLGSQAGN